MDKPTCKCVAHDGKQCPVPPTGGNSFLMEFVGFSCKSWSKLAQGWREASSAGIAKGKGSTADTGTSMFAHFSFYKRPIIVIENNDEAASEENITEIKAELRASGYIVLYKVLWVNAYGIPVSRKRFYLIGWCLIFWDIKDEQAFLGTAEEMWTRLQIEVLKPQEFLLSSMDPIVEKEREEILANKQEEKNATCDWLLAHGKLLEQRGLSTSQVQAPAKHRNSPWWRTLTQQQQSILGLKLFDGASGVDVEARY